MNKMSVSHVFEFMKEHYVKHKKVPETDELVMKFPRTGVADIMRAERIFEDWMGDMSG